jgi:glycosyltransferase involved in cell wall biosynthesis
MDKAVALFTDTFFEVNGAAHTLRKVAEAFEKRGDRMDVYCYGDRHTVEERGSVRVVQFDHRMAGNYYEKLHFEMLPDMRIGEFWRKAMRKERYGVVHLATPGSIGLAGRSLARRWNVPLVGTYHTHLADYAALRVTPKIRRAILRASWSYMKWFYAPCKSLLGPTRGVVKELEDQGFAGELGIFTRGIDLELFSMKKRRRKHERSVTAYVGRCAPEKGVLVLPEVTEGIDTDLMIVGDGPERPALEKRLKRATFTGYLFKNDLATAYADSDILLFPSKTDTFGNVVLEAMASGVVPIVAKGPGPSDYVDHGVNAYVCDTPADMREALNELVSNRAKRDWMRANASAFASKYDWSEAVDGLVAHYRNAVST